MKISQDVLIFMAFVFATLLIVVCLGMWAQATPVSYYCVIKSSGEAVLFVDNIENSSEVIVRRSDGSTMVVEKADLVTK